MNDKRLIKQELDDIRVFFYQLTDTYRDYIPNEKSKKLTEEMATKLFKEIRELQNELGEAREHCFSIEQLWFDQEKENEQLTEEIVRLRRENERLWNELSNKMV